MASLTSSNSREGTIPINTWRSPGLVCGHLAGRGLAGLAWGTEQESPWPARAYALAPSAGSTPQGSLYPYTQYHWALWCQVGAPDPQTHPGSPRELAAFPGSQEGQTEPDLWTNGSCPQNALRAVCPHAPPHRGSPGPTRSPGKVPQVSHRSLGNPPQPL